MSTYGVYYKRILFYIGYPVVSGFCLLIALGAVLQNKILSQVMWFFTYWLVLLLALISTISMTIVVSHFTHFSTSFLQFILFYLFLIPSTTLAFPSFLKLIIFFLPSPSSLPPHLFHHFLTLSFFFSPLLCSRFITSHDCAIYFSLF